MRLILNKLKKLLGITAVIAAMLCSMCAVSAGAIKGFNKSAAFSFCSETENSYSQPGGTAVASGDLTWQLYDKSESRMSRDGLYITDGYIKLKDNNPVNALSDFRIEIVYSSSAEGTAEADRPFLLTSTKKYTLNQLVTDSGTVLGITENGDVYYKGEKINHADGGKAYDILTSKNPKINPNDECRVTVTYLNGKLTVALTYNSGKTTVKLAENYSCEISGLKQFILGGDKSRNLEKMTYKALNVYTYGDYVPNSGVRAVVQTGEAIKEYDNANTALSDALSQSKNGQKPVLMLCSDITLSKPITVENGKSLTVDLNGHTVNRNCCGVMASDGYAFLVGEGASLTVEDSSPDAQNYSSAIKGGVITGGAGDGVGGGIQLQKNSKLTMTGGSVAGCITNDHGGAIRVAGSGVKISISDAGFYSNMTLDSSDNTHGGAIYADGYDCEITVKNSIFEGNYSEDNGGALYINDGELTAYNCAFHNNSCLDDGGAVYIESDSKVFLENCIFTDNRSDGQGGAVYCNSSDGTRLSGKYKNNSAGGAGGALFVNGEAVSIQDIEITGNITGDRGGGLYVDEMYDINIQGLAVIRNNRKTDKSRDDMFLDSIGVASAKIYDGGLYEDSEVWVLTSSSTQTVSEYISAYQQRYFHCDDSSKVFQFSADSSKTRKQVLITSAVGSGNHVFIIVTVVLIIIAAAIAVIYKRKKKGAENK